MKRLFLLSLVTYCSFGAAEPFRIDGTEIVGYGIFTSKQVSSGSADDMRKNSVKNVRFLEYTDEIPARLGTEFGFQFVIAGSRRTKPIAVTYQIKFPEPGLQQPAGELHLHSSSVDQVRVGAKLLHGYGFDEPWELLPGEWVFEVWHEGTKLIGKSFTVYPAAGD